MSCCGSGSVAQYVSPRWTQGQVRNRRDGGTPDLNRQFASLSVSLPVNQLRRTAPLATDCLTKLGMKCNPSIPAVGPTEIAG